MKSLIVLLACTLTFTSVAQKLPKKSAKAEVEQTVGLTEVEIEYSRPNVNGRTIFGDLVPYGQVWRLGANEPTTIEINNPITINGQELDTGSYAIFAIPEKNFWTVVFNTDTEQWGAGNYDEKKNVLAYQAAVNVCEFTESFTVSFSNVNEQSAVLNMQWASTQVLIPFTTNTEKAVEKSINDAIAKGEDLEKVYYNAADYAIDLEDLAKAKEMIGKSLEIERSYYNVFLLAQIVKETDVKEAKKLASEAVDLAKKAEKDGWANYIDRSMNEW